MFYDLKFFSVAFYHDDKKIYTFVIHRHVNRIGIIVVFRFLNQVGYDCYDTQAEEWYFTNINEPDVYQEICKKEQKI